MTAALTTAVQAVLDRVGERGSDAPATTEEPVAVAPGSLGSWAEDDAS